VNDGEVSRLLRVKKPPSFLSSLSSSCTTAAPDSFLARSAIATAAPTCRARNCDMIDARKYRLLSVSLLLRVINTPSASLSRTQRAVPLNTQKFCAPREKKSKSAQLTSNKEKKRSSARLLRALFKSLSLSLCVCVCVCLSLGLLNHHHRGGFCAGARACAWINITQLRESDCFLVQLARATTTTINFRKEGKRTRIIKVITERARDGRHRGV